MGRHDLVNSTTGCCAKKGGDQEEKWSTGHGETTEGDGELVQDAAAQERVRKTQERHDAAAGLALYTRVSRCRCLLPGFMQYSVVYRIFWCNNL